MHTFNYSDREQIELYKTVGHIDNSICKIACTSPIFCFLGDYPSSGRKNVPQMTLKRQRCPDVDFIDRSESTAHLEVKGCFHTHLRV